MKATITNVTKNSMQVDIEFTVSDGKGFSVDRVLSLPEEKLAQMDDAALEELIRSEVRRHEIVNEKEASFKELIGREILI